MSERPAIHPSDDEAIALLVDMLNIDSVSTHEAPLAEYLAAAMQRLGFRATIDGAGNPVGDLGAGPRHIVLLGHIDTVPGHVPVRREGNRLYGRGAVDAKGPMAAFIVAAARAGSVPGLRVTVVGAVEEEAASSKGAYSAATQYRPDYCVIGEPSNWDRITLGYKGRLLIDYALERAMSHTAGRERSVGEEAVAYWLVVARWAEGFNRDKEGAFAALDASLRSINTTSDGLAERVAMTIGLRLPLDLDIAELKRLVTEEWPGVAQVTTRGLETPFRADKRNPLTGAFLAAIRAEGGKASFVTKTGTSDMNVLGPRWGCPIVAYGPGDSALDHTPDEHIEVGEYLAAIRVLSEVLRRLAG